MSISIQGVDKVQLLKGLWEKASAANFYKMSGAGAPKWDEEMAKAAVLKYIDYYCGRCIKCDLSGDNVDPWLYDRDAGAGAFESVVKSLRK